MQKDEDGKGLDDQSQSLTSLDGKHVALYFIRDTDTSDFTETLKKVYHELKATKDKPFEVVTLISSVSQMKTWQSSHPWSAILCPPSSRRALEVQYGLYSTPAFLVLNPDGSLSSCNATHAVREVGASAFPWTGMEDEEKPGTWDTRKLLSIGMIFFVFIIAFVKFASYRKNGGESGIVFEEAEL
jgi:hypothetical protein